MLPLIVARLAINTFDTLMFTVAAAVLAEERPEKPDHGSERRGHAENQRAGPQPDPKA
jgi:hypothetical protein